MTWILDTTLILLSQQFQPISPRDKSCENYLSPIPNFLQIIFIRINNSLDIFPVINNLRFDLYLVIRLNTSNASIRPLPASGLPPKTK
jgi:hypothetical protein